jgi:SlyX protein
MAVTEDQFTGLETKLAYLEDFINKLQAIAVEHSDSIDRLKMENRALRAKLGEVADAIQEIPNLRPPHY